MGDVPSIDPCRSIDWGQTSSDYAAYRPGPPPRFYERLRQLGVGIRGQRILDLGTGTGLLAREFTRTGCEVIGIDVSEGQTAAARRLAQEEQLAAEFHVAPAEDTGLPPASFDVITANQCWLGDHSRSTREPGLERGRANPELAIALIRLARAAAGEGGGDPPDRVPACPLVLQTLRPLEEEGGDGGRASHPGGLVAAYHIIRDRVPYRDLGPDHFDRLGSERSMRHYVRPLEQLGHRVALDRAA